MFNRRCQKNQLLPAIDKDSEQHLDPEIPQLRDRAALKNEDLLNPCGKYSIKKYKARQSNETVSFKVCRLLTGVRHRLPGNKPWAAFSKWSAVPVTVRRVSVRRKAGETDTPETDTETVRYGSDARSGNLDRMAPLYVPALFDL